MARRFVLLALSAAAAAALVARRRAPRIDPRANGGARARSARLRRQVEEARERVRRDVARAAGE